MFSYSLISSLPSVKIVGGGEIIFFLVVTKEKMKIENFFTFETTSGHPVKDNPDMPMCRLADFPMCRIILRKMSFVHLLCLLLSLFLSNSPFQLVDSIYLHSYEYLQYEKFRAFPPFDHKEFFHLADGCENGKKEKMFQCSSNVFSRIQQSNPDANGKSHWNRTDSIINQKPSCRYSIDQIHSSSSSFMSSIQLKITQSHCQDGFTQLPGGSSFYILAEGLFQLMCTITDHFDNSYSVVCPHIPFFLQNDHPMLETLRNTQGCMYITIILDYEHYDAFSEFGSYSGQVYPQLEVFLLNREKYCWKETTADHPVHHNHHSIYSFHLPPPSVGERSLSNGAWKLKDSILPIPVTAEELLTLAKNYSNYQWIWEINESNNVNKNRYIETKNFQSCYPSSSSSSSSSEVNKLLEFRFLGESHMRHYYDYMISRMYPEFIASLKPKHGETYHENYLFDLRAFCTHMTDFVVLLTNDLLKKSDTQEVKNVTMLLQTGAWDLAYWPLRQILENSNEGPYFKEQMLSLFVKDSKKVDFVKSHFWMLWIDIMLYPRCVERDRVMDEKTIHGCLQAKQSSNNYVIEVANQYFESFLLDNILPSEGSKGGITASPHFRMLHSRKMYYPRLLSLKYVCVMHMMCGRATDYSEEGEVATEAIQRELCEILQGNT
jgi:hypothetical protein